PPLSVGPRRSCRSGRGVTSGNRRIESVAKYSERDRRVARRRAEQPVDHARLRDGVLAAEQQLPFTADRVAQVLELEPVGVDRLQLDALDAVVAADLDHRLVAMP